MLQANPVIGYDLTWWLNIGGSSCDANCSLLRTSPVTFSTLAALRPFLLPRRAHSSMTGATSMRYCVFIHIAKTAHKRANKQALTSSDSSSSDDDVYEERDPDMLIVCVCVRVCACECVAKGIKGLVNPRGLSPPGSKRRASPTIRAKHTTESAPSSFSG